MSAVPVTGSSPVRVREVVWTDFDELREIYYHLYEERDRGDPIGITLYSEERPSLADEVLWFAGGYRKVLMGEAVWSVAERDGHAVGSCEIHRLGATATSEQAHVGVLGILVHADHRGTGVGSALLRHALTAAREKFEVVRLSVFSVNEGARRLYERFGFRPSGHGPRAVKRGGTYFDEEEMILLFDDGAAAPANH